VASFIDYNQITHTLTKINSDIINIANQASLKISVDNDLLEIKHKLKFGDKSTLGVIFFLFGGIFLILTPFVKFSDTMTKLIGIIIGFLIVVFTVLTLIRQVIDGIQIKGHIMTYRQNLKKQIFILKGDAKIKMKTEVMQIRRAGTLGSDFIIVTHYLHDGNNETPILKFSMEKKEEDNAKKLGNELTWLINARFRQ